MSPKKEIANQERLPQSAESNEIKKRYRQIGHNLNPIVTIAGKGLSENVLAELDRALEDHELIKVKFAITDREARSQLINEMCSLMNASLIQEIGKVALIFRAAKKSKPHTSNLHA